MNGTKRLLIQSTRGRLRLNRSDREACAVSEIKYRADFVPQNELHWQEVNQTTPLAAGFAAPIRGETSPAKVAPEISDQ
jgi:hypothetical protein